MQYFVIEIVVVTEYRNRDFVPSLAIIAVSCSFRNKCPVTTL